MLDLLLSNVVIDTTIVFTPTNVVSINETLYPLLEIRGLEREGGGVCESCEVSVCMCDVCLQTIAIVLWKNLL